MDQEINNPEHTHHLHSKHWLTLALMFILTIVLVGGGVYYLMKQEYEGRAGKTLAMLKDEQTLRQQCEEEKEGLKKEKSQASTPEIPEEHPTTQQGLDESLEEVVKKLLFKENPQWKEKDYNISISIEVNKNNNAFGKFDYSGEVTYREGSRKDKGKGIWFISKSEEDWTLVTTSYTGYWGLCQDFQKFGFLPEMTPDCWDTEKYILIDTVSPELFYKNEFTKTDKTKLINAFLKYIRNEETSQFYINKDLYVRVDNNTDNYLRGTILIGGSKNYSSPYFLAVKQNGKWEVIFNGQDIPPCDLLNKYEFPDNMTDGCY